MFSFNDNGGCIWPLFQFFFSFQLR
jgi:hypothetical protein